MTISQASDIISFFAGLIVFAKIINMTHGQCVDETRSDLFTLRDEMFLYATDNGLLETEAYQQLRSLMNGFIRYAHRLSATRVLLIFIASRLVPPPLSASFLSNWDAYSALLEEPHRQKLQSFFKKHELIIATHIIHRSLVLRGLIRAYAVLLKLRHKIGGRAVAEQVAENVVIDHAPWTAMEVAAASA